MRHKEYHTPVLMIWSAIFVGIAIVVAIVAQFVIRW
jgi:hypothetical protein